MSELSSMGDATLMDDDNNSESSVEAVLPSGSEASLAAILRIVQGNSLKLNVVKPLKKSFERLAENTSALETQV